jgi:hypothetical protein
VAKLQQIGLQSKEYSHALLQFRIHAIGSTAEFATGSNVKWSLQAGAMGAQRLCRRLERVAAPISAIRHGIAKQWGLVLPASLDRTHHVA